MDWWMAKGDTCHVCSNKSLFNSYEQVEGKDILMGNQVQKPMLGQGKVMLQFSYGRTLFQTDVLHVPSVRKSLVSSDKLNKDGLSQVIE